MVSLLRSPAGLAAAPVSATVTAGAVPAPAAMAAPKATPATRLTPARSAGSATGLAGSAVPAPEPEAVVQAILIEGAVNVKPGDISSLLKTRIGAVLTRETLREDLKEVWHMDRFDDVSADVVAVEGGVRVTLLVRERPVIRELRFVGIKELAEKDLKEKFPVKEGDFFDPARGKEGTDQIAAELRDKGYPDAAVKTELVPAEKERGKMTLVVSANEGLKLHVRKITFAGIKAFPEGALKKTLKNREAAFLFQSGLFLVDELDRDKERLLQYYKNEGYQKARVTDLEVTRTGKGKEADKAVAGTSGALPPAKLDEVLMKFTVIEGIQYNARALSFAGMTLFTEKELRGKVDLDPGSKLSQKRLDEGLAAIRELYTTRGYIYAQVEPVFTFDDTGGEADVAITIREGTVAIVDRILIRGNEETKDKIILRELEVKEGEEFNTEHIRRSQENIYNLGFFEDVKIYTEPSLKTGRENLVFEVKERQTGTVSLGGGYSSQFGLVGFLQLTKANLFGLGIRVSAEWEIGQKRKNIQLDYFDPYFLDSRISLGLGFWDTNRDLTNTFSQRSTGGSVEFGHRFPGNFWRASVSYKYEVNTVKPLPGGKSLKDIGVAEGAQVTSSPGVSLSYEHRDNIFDPMKGWAHRWSAQVAGGPLPSAGMKFLGGDTSFYKVVFDSSYFQPLIKLGIRPSLALHTRMGRAWGFGGRDVPIFEKFFLGGTDSVRGYGERELGPKLNGTPIGGRAMAQFNAEIKWPIIPRVLTLAAPFYDMGQSWNVFPPSAKSIVDEKGGVLATSVGLGIRLTVPGTIIVIRLDYGWGQTQGFNPPHHGKLHFNIGNIF